MSGGSCATKVTKSSGIGGHERECGHRATAAREHLDRAGVERLDDGVYVDCLDRGRMIDATVFAGAAAEAARVIGDHGAVGEVRRQRAEAAGGHGLTDHEQWWASVRGGQRAVDVIGDVGLVGLKMCVCVVVMAVLTAVVLKTHRRYAQSTGRAPATQRLSGPDVTETSRL